LPELKARDVVSNENIEVESGFIIGGNGLFVVRNLWLIGRK